MRCPSHARALLLSHLLYQWLPAIAVDHFHYAEDVQAYPSYQELNYNQSLDHFNPESHTRWSHRYLLNNDSWDGRGKLANGCKGPILMYTGNEGPITAFWGSNGFMNTVLAPKFGALLFFPEQRFYGASMPFGNASMTPEHLKYLTTAQVLEDYVELLENLKATVPGAAGCPVVAFGGSYGGTLTALIRASHPSSVVGGLAASSELGYYDVAGWAARGVNAFTFDDIVARDYQQAAPQCMDAIQATKKEMEAASDAELVKVLHLCNKKGLGPQKSSLFTYALESLPQQDYPYAIGSMPAKPVNFVCSLLVKGFNSKDPSALLQAASAVVALSFGYDGSSCIEDYGVAGPGNTPGDGPGLGSWGWQSCTETLHRFSARVIRNYTFNYDASANICANLYGSSVIPDTGKLAREFGGYALADGSSGIRNLIWSQGTLDPWHGWFQNMAAPAKGSGIYHFLMKDSAHHLDLRAPHPQDPPDVTAARAQYEKIIRGWIEEASGSSEAVMV